MRHIHRTTQIEKNILCADGVRLSVTIRYVPTICCSCRDALQFFFCYNIIKFTCCMRQNHPPHRFVDNVDAPQPTEPAAPATREDAPCSDGADSRHGGEAPPTAEQRTPIHPHKHSPFLNNHQPHRRHRCRPRIARRRWMKR